MPMLLITSGGPGSGKSTLIQESFKHLLGSVPDYEMFLVDDLVEKDDNYKQKVNKIMEEFECKPPFDSQKCNPTRPTEALLSAFKQAYFSVRQMPGCNRNPESLTCDQLNDKGILLAMEQKENIVIETTGSYIPTWIFDLKNVENYRVVFAYSIVAFDVLLTRNSSRATRSLLNYFYDRSQPAPRMIDIRKEVFAPMIDQICKTLLMLRNSCLQGSTDAQCVSKSKVCLNDNTVDNLLIYDNSGSKFALIYDHRNTKDHAISTKDFKIFIEKAFLTPKFGLEL